MGLMASKQVYAVLLSMLSTVVVVLLHGNHGSKTAGQRECRMSQMLYINCSTLQIVCLYDTA